jgi:hypothetical protein
MSSEDAAKRDAAEVPVVQPEPGTESSNPSPSASESVTRRFRGWGRKSPAFAGACAWNGIREGNLVAANRRFWALFLW